MDAIAKYEKKNYWPKNFFAKNYQKCTARGCRAHNVFDYQSIMHYGPELEGTNITVIKPKKICKDKDCGIGQREKLSMIDKKDIISVYGCGNYI